MKSISQNKVLKNSIWIIAERSISAVMLAVITILAARYLGTEQYGVLNYGLTLSTMFAAVMKLGIDSIIVNELILNKKREGEFLGTSLALRFISSLLSIVAILMLMMITKQDNSLLVGVTAVQSLVLIFQAGTIIDFWFQSKLISKYVSIAKITATGVASAYSAYLLLTGKELIWFAFSTVITAAVSLVVMVFLYFKQGGQPLKVTGDAAKYLLSKSHHFIIANIMAIIYVQIDKLMVGNILGENELGLYSAAILLSTTWLFFPSAILTSIQPTVFSAKRISEHLYINKLKQMYFILFWICVLICLVLSLTASFLIPILFGTGYIQSIQVVQIVIWSVPLSILGMARNVWIVSEGKGGTVKYILMMGLILNVGANLFIIPIYGIIGAASVTVMTEFFTCFIAPLFFKRTRAHTRLLLDALSYRLS